MTGLTNEWLDTEVSISRKELGELMAIEVQSATLAARDVLGKDSGVAEFIEGLLKVFSASLGSEIFKRAEIPQDREF